MQYKIANDELNGVCVCVAVCLLDVLCDEVCRPEYLMCALCEYGQ